GGDLFTAEGLHGPGPFDHRQTGGLHRGEPARALRAVPASSDAAAVVSGAGIDHARIRVAAIRTVHQRLPMTVRNRPVHQGYTREGHISGAPGPVRPVPGPAGSRTAPTR